MTGLGPGPYLLFQASRSPGPRRIDLLLGRLNEPLIVAFVLGTVLGLFLLALEGVTLVYVWVRMRREKRREGRRPAIRDGLIQRIAQDDPDWESWVTGHDGTEQELLREEIESFLAKLDGQERRRLQDAGRRVGIAVEAVASIRSGDRHERLTGLKWLTLLEHPVETEFIHHYCQQDPTVRAAGARLLYELENSDAATAGTELLLGAPERPMTSFGIDTLYRLHEGDPTELFAYADDHASEWSTTVTLQVLLVVSELSMVPEDAPTEWLITLFDHDSPAVRAATARAFVGFGWRERLRELVSRSELIADSDPVVRIAACEMLGSWSDDVGVWELKSMAITDSDPRVRVAATRELVTRAGADPSDRWLPDGDVDTAVQWVRNEQAIAARRTA